MFRFNMHSEAFFGAFIIARLAKIPLPLLMVGFCVVVQIFKKFCLVVTFFTRICDSKVNARVYLKFISFIEFFIAFIAREYWPWIVQMYISNVFLEGMLFTKSSVAMIASVLQAFMDTLYVPFQIR